MPRNIPYEEDTLKAAALILKVRSINITQLSDQQLTELWQEVAVLDQHESVHALTALIADVSYLLIAEIEKRSA